MATSGGSCNEIAGLCSRCIRDLKSVNFAWELLLVEGLVLGGVKLLGGVRLWTWVFEALVSGLGPGQFQVGWIGLYWWAQLTRRGPCLDGLFPFCRHHCPFLSRKGQGRRGVP